MLGTYSSASQNEPSRGSTAILSRSTPRQLVPSGWQEPSADGSFLGTERTKKPTAGPVANRSGIGSLTSTEPSLIPKDEDSLIAFLRSPPPVYIARVGEIQNQLGA
jgi:hypothetical protein